MGRAPETSRSRGETGAARRPRWLARLNAGLLRLGLPIGTQRVLSVPGRASGRLRSTPVSPVTVAGRRHIVATSAAADWVKNARAAGGGCSPGAAGGSG